MTNRESFEAQYCKIKGGDVMRPVPIMNNNAD